MPRNHTAVPGARGKRKGSLVADLWPNAVIPYDISKYYGETNDIQKTKIFKQSTKITQMISSWISKTAIVVLQKKKMWSHVESGHNIIQSLGKHVVSEQSDIRSVRDAMGNWEEHTCIRFRQATPSDKHKVTFTVSSS